MPYKDIRPAALLFHSDEPNILLEICAVAERNPHYCCTAVSAGDITGTCPAWTLLDMMSPC